VWLRDDVYATHGHYSDRHITVPMFERLGAGVMARIGAGDGAGDSAGPGRAEDYEATLAPIYAWIHAVAQSRTGALNRSTHGTSTRAWRALAGSGRRKGLRRRGMAAAFPALVAGLNRAGLGPLRANLSGTELRRAGLRALTETLARLDVTASHVIFGHTHRAGPLPADDLAEWRTPRGTALLNTGSWVYESVYLGRSPAASPYRPGFCAVLDDSDRSAPPVVRNLLDGVVSFEALGASLRSPA
jgi:hypothetical protein